MNEKLRKERAHLVLKELNSTITTSEKKRMYDIEIELDYLEVTTYLDEFEVIAKANLDLAKDMKSALDSLP